MTSSAVRDRAFPTLNAVRGIGALLVVMTHASFNTATTNRGWFGAMTSRFDFGVTLFFILSGFLLARPFLLAVGTGLPAPSVRHYFWKRALRILPLYWVVVTVGLLIDPDNAHADLGEWVAQLTLTQIYHPEPLASSLTQMWSLCTEVAFYVLLPLLVLLVTGRRTKGLVLRRVLMRSALLAALGVAWQCSVATLLPQAPHAAQWLPGYLPWFLIGVAFAAISADDVVRQRPHALDRLAADLTGCWLLATALFALACSPIAGPRLLIIPGAWESGIKVVLYGAAGAFYVLPLVFGPEREGAVRRALSSRVPFFLGEISYGVFAIHMLLLINLLRVLDIRVFSGHFWGVLVLVLVPTIALASLSFYFFERPLMRLKNVGFMRRLEPAGGIVTTSPAGEDDDKDRSTNSAAESGTHNSTPTN